jgi:four helix bundle protein
MSRDPYRLEAFGRADDLVVATYRATRSFPVAERFGLQSQIRRSAVSVAANLVEGCARRSARDYLHFVGIAIGSASEVRYLISLAVRLELISPIDGERLKVGYTHVIRGLQSLINALTSRGLRPEA